MKITTTKAFTLIELVVVIVILGLLAALGAFTYTTIADNARTEAMDKHLAQFNTSYSGAITLGQTPQEAFEAASRDLSNTGVTSSEITTANLTRINYASNPSFETNTNNMGYNGGHSGWGRVAEGIERTWALEYGHPDQIGVSQGPYLRQNYVPASRVMRASVYARVKTPNNTSSEYRIGVEEYNSAGVRIDTESTFITIGPEWKRFHANFTTNAETVHTTIVVYGNGPVAAGQKLQVDGFSIESTNQAGDYFDGASAGGYWQGTPENSESRINEPARTRWVNLSKNNITWCVGLNPVKAITTKLEIYDGAGRPPAGTFKKSSCG